MGVEEEVKKQFAREAVKYTTSSVHNNQEDLDLCVQIIQPNPDWNVLDVATGTGHLGLKVAPHVNQVTGLDLTKEMLEEAEKSAKRKGIDNFTTIEGDVHRLPFSNEIFDLVMVRIAPHHFSDISEALSEMVRVLKSEGRLFIEDTLAPSDCSDLFNHIEKLRDPSHVKDLTEVEWKKVLADSGLSLTKFHKRSKVWNLEVWTERMSTPKNKVEEIMRILQERYAAIGDVRVEKADVTTGENSFQSMVRSWTLFPYNGYFLAKKS